MGENRQNNVIVIVCTVFVLLSHFQTAVPAIDSEIVWNKKYKKNPLFSGVIVRGL